MLQTLEGNIANKASVCVHSVMNGVCDLVVALGVFLATDEILLYPGAGLGPLVETIQKL